MKFILWTAVYWGISIITQRYISWPKYGGPLLYREDNKKHGGAYLLAMLLELFFFIYLYLTFVK